MQEENQTMSRRGLLFSLTIFGLAATLFVVPSMFQSKAGNTGKGLVEKTVSHVPGLENYDIRTDKSAHEKIAGFRATSGRNASNVADLRQSFVDGENALRTKVPTLKVEYNSDIKTPEVIAPDVKQGRAFLTTSSAQSRADILRDFVGENSSLIGVSRAQANSLKVTADYTNPDGNLSYAHLEQFINDVPVFRGEVKAGFTKSGEMIRVINNLAPGLEYESLSNDFRNPVDAVKFAAGHLNVDANTLNLEIDDKNSDNLRTSFGKTGTQAEKMYFPTEPGVARAAWRVLLYAHNGGYYVIVDAETGTLLWRKNLTEDQTQSASYSVYVNPNAMMNVADNPFPMTPGPTSPTNVQGAAIPRTLITIVGNEAPYAFNNLGWITDGNNTTDGNNVEAGLDRKLPNTGSPANPNDTDPDGKAIGSPSRVFDFPYTPGNPNTNSGDAPLPTGQTPTGCLASTNTDVPTNFQKGITTSLFYISNRIHDELYRLGFTEQARNFQHDNFGRGGVGNDRVAAQAQDCSGTNNANFTTPADGSRPTMQMYLWTAPAPDFDGSLDADVIVHEYTHGLSNRLHGNSGGLSTNMARGMGEGWGDFYGHAMLSEASDPINGIYTTGAYDTYSPNFPTNYYYGIRRFPKAVIAFTGGPNNRPHNPLTFADIDSTQQNLNDGAYAPDFVGVADQVHNAGEVWSSALWEVRAKFVTRLGWGAGNRKALQLITDGMKLAPLGPTFLQERDAIIAAAQASSAAPEAIADVNDVWSGFALRGMGLSATVNAVGNGGGTARVTEAFDVPGLVQTPVLTSSDSTGDNDGFPEPGEPITFSVPLTNLASVNATGTTLQIAGGNSADYGTIAVGQTVTRSITYTVPANAPCGSAVTVSFTVTSSVGTTNFTRVLIIGVPQTTYTENFDGVTAPAFPANWTATVVQNGTNFVTTTNNADTAPNAAFAVNPATVGGGTDLTSPSIPITASAATVSFRNRFDTEGGWDGGVVELSINGDTFQDVITRGGRFVENGYNGVLGAGTNNPLANRNAWSGNSNGYINSTIQLPAAAAGQNVRLKWRFGADDNTVGQGPNPGWYIDTIRVSGNYACSYDPVVSDDARADFDGDGRTDFSVFRPSEGNWYLSRSTAGFTGVNWGLSGDQLVPGDFDGDDKTDVAIFRPSDTVGVADFYVLNSNGFTATGYEWGLVGDIPVIGDYDGDDKADFAVYRPSTGIWYWRASSQPAGFGQFNFGGQAGDIPIVADWDGDGKTDFSIKRGTSWLAHLSLSPAPLNVNFGTATDLAVPADYDGDGKDDIAVFHPEDGTWHIRRTADGSVYTIQFGLNGDIPVPGDYDGDGKYDQAVYRSGDWYVWKSTGGFIGFKFGLASDKPVPKAYVP